MLSVCQDMSDLLFTGLQRDAYRDLAFRRDTDCVTFSVAVDEGVGKCVQFTLVFDT